ncbi:MAG: hypothetical protein AAGH64_01740 [Planctomycetota bacterium]
MPRRTRPTLLTCLALALAPHARAQSLDLGSMGGPDLGERSAFVGRSSFYERAGDELFADAGGWTDTAGATTLASDTSLGVLARAYMRWMCARMLSGENARNAAADHRMVTGRLLSDAMDPFDAIVASFVADAGAVHAGDADPETSARYALRRAALRAFVLRARASFGTPESVQPVGFTIRSLDNALRPVIGELTPLLTDDQRALVARAWGRSLPDDAGSSDVPPGAMDRAGRSLVHADESRRLRALASRARASAELVRAIDDGLYGQAELRTATAIEGLTGAERGSAERFLAKMRALGPLLEIVAALSADASDGARAQLNVLAEDAVRAVCSDGGSVGGSDDPLVDAMGVCVRALRVALDRRALEEPERMTGNTRRAWLLMHAEQSDREEALVADLRDLIARPSRVTSTALVSSVVRTRTGYERLLAIRMCDDWLDELREGGRLARLLGPTISQRSRNLMIFTLRDRIRDAADRDVREGAIDDLNLLRARAELFGRTDLEDALARDEPRWLDETLGSRLSSAMDDARSAWVGAWVDDDAGERARWAERLGILTRARDMVALAERIDADAAAWCARVPTCPIPADASVPLRDRVRGLASGAVRAALSDDPTTDADDRDVRARLTAAEDGSSGARALLDLGAIVPSGMPSLGDPLVRLIACAGVLAPGDHPARVHRHDVASYVRWLHELRHSRSASDREAILAHLDEVGADVSARLSGE